MSTANNNPNTQNEDIDLLLLIERAVLFFRKYKWVFIISIILGLSFGSLIYLKSPKVYKSRLILHSFTLSNPDYIEIFNNWNRLLKNKEYSSLASVFNCPETVIRHVREIKAFEVQKVFTQGNPNGFYVDVLITDNAYLDELKNGIINGLENTDFIKRQLAVKKSNLLQLIDQVSIEITKLDSTKSRVERMINSNQNHSSPLIIDISGLHSQLIAMNEKLVGYKESLKFTNAVQVLDGFSKFSKPAGPHLLVWLAIGLIGFLSLGYVFALYLSVKSSLKKRGFFQPRNQV